MTDSARRDKRFPSKQLLLVRCETWAEFAELYASDVSRGGMFIATDEPPPILSEIEVDMRLPEGHSVQLKATIVHVLGVEQATSEGKQAGVGVQFLNLNPQQKQQIVQLVEFARWEGDNPNASFANRMFESSTSMPPSKVLDALPPEPEAVSQASLRASASSSQPAARNSARAAVPRSNQPAPRPSQRAAGAGAEARGESGAESGSSRRPSSPRAVTTQPPSSESGQRTPSQAARARRADSGPTQPVAEDPAQAPPGPPPPPKPLDVVKLKLGMTHLVHKRIDQGIKTFAEILQESPGDKQATQWFHIAHARLRLKNNDDDGAAEHYQKALEVDENNHEARKFVREHHSKKRLNSLPFGRYFVKKQ
jgi:uncharacterized protein (TIGR02266 family)